jgi:hypothetical protein
VRQFRLSVLLLSLVIAFAGSTLADTVSMNFLGPGGNNSGGVYTYPYQFSIDGGAPVSLICDTFDNEVYAGETWTATVMSLWDGAQAGSGAMFAGQVQNYEAAGLIFKGIINGSIDANAGNWAIWGLFSDNAKNNSAYWSSGANSLASFYLWKAYWSNASDFAGLVLYTPIRWSGLMPQEYIGYVNVPEPSEIAMILFMAMGSVLAFVFRKRLGLNLAIGQQA